jgi:3-dehydroquinate dehydratase-2
LSFSTKGKNMKNISEINLPNINLLGVREPEKYGDLTLAELEKIISQKAEKVGVSCNFFQSNIEGEIVTFIQNARNLDGIILNAAAYSHTSIAILDAILAADTPTIEVHMTNIFARENFRQKSIISAACIGVIAGFGIKSYLLALEVLTKL